MANNIKKFFGKFANKKTTKKSNNVIELEIQQGGKVSYAGYKVGDTKTQEYEASTLLTELRSKTNVGEQIEVIAAKDPDVSQAVWAFQRLCMQGITIEIKDLNGKRLPDAENLFNYQCRFWNRLGEDGLDGIIDSLHKVGLLYNVMMVEVVVGDINQNTFSGIYMIDPRTIEWTLEQRDGVEKWIPYQDQDGNKVDLTKGNVFWVVVNPDIANPGGPYLLESAVAAVDYKLQTIKDSSAVLRRQGYPYNIFSINKERVINSLPANSRNNRKEVKQAIRDAIDLAASVAVNREPTQDIVVTDDIEVERSSSASAGSSIDARSWFETIDIQMLNGCKTLGFLMNRNSGTTESWGTVQMKVITDMVQSFQKKSKRLIEDIGAIWLQLNGIQGTLKVTHNPLDYQSEKQKWDAQIQKDSHYEKAESQGWISTDEAANGALGVEKATGTKSTQSNNSNNQENNNSNDKKTKKNK